MDQCKATTMASRVALAFSLTFTCFVSSLDAQFSRDPQPLPSVKTFLVSEVGYGYRLNDYGSNTFGLQPRDYFSSDLGVMSNTSESFAVGVTNFVGADAEGSVRWGVKLRLRQWLSSNASLDVAPGLLIADSRDDAAMPGFTGSARISPNDVFGAMAQVEVVPHESGNTDRAVYLGANVGSTPGGWGTGAAAAIGMVVGLIYLIAEGIEDAS